MSFTALGLAEPILRAVAAEGYSTPTPIQAQSIPVVMDGSDLFGCAQTGTGKTAAFALPVLHRLWTNRPAPGAGRKIRALVLSPTRELASQIADSFAAYGKNTPLRHAVIYGGVGQNPQVKALRNGIDILVATPGRLLDLMNQGHVDLRAVEVFVLDEADRMLDLGFFPDIRKIVARLSSERQTLLFSATMPEDILELAHSILREPVQIKVTPVASAAELIEQSFYFVAKRNKPILLEHILKNAELTRALVFTRTKRSADRVCERLQKAGVRSAAIHGDKTQSNRERALEAFRSGRTAVLVATDIAARGIDVDAVSHVFNYDIPEVAETYVHRIGRTGRAGASGVALSFVDHDERGDFRQIEKLLRRKIEEKSDHPEYPPAGENRPVEEQRRPDRSKKPGRPQATHRPQKPGRRPEHQRHETHVRTTEQVKPVDDVVDFGAGVDIVQPETHVAGDTRHHQHRPQTGQGHRRPGAKPKNRRFGPQENNRGGTGAGSRGRGRRGRGRPAGAGNAGKFRTHGGANGGSGHGSTSGGSGDTQQS
ncbi:MAG: DEAD/DEAH box helicase [Planctomycetes bacterium]|nr:DEAD/DEAH box helicase [Planctomycetota bacterium]